MSFHPVLIVAVLVSLSLLLVYFPQIAVAAPPFALTKKIVTTGSRVAETTVVVTTTCQYISC